MTREEHLKFCKICKHREMNSSLGLVCNLTGARADFEGECANFEKDPAARPVIVDDTEALPPEVIKRRLDKDMVEKLRMEQNLPRAIIAGLAAALISAGLWAVITIATDYMIGYMAVAVGAFVGFAIRFAGKGIDRIFGIWGAALSLFGVLLGYFFTIVGIFANYAEMDFFETLINFNFDLLSSVMEEILGPIDFLFFGIAIYEGYKFSFKPITEKDLVELEKSANK